MHFQPGTACAQQAHKGNVRIRMRAGQPDETAAVFARGNKRRTPCAGIINYGIVWLGQTEYEPVGKLAGLLPRIALVFSRARAYLRYLPYVVKGYYGIGVIFQGFISACYLIKASSVLLSVYKAVSEKHTETGIAGQKREYESKGSYSFSAYSDKTAIGTLVFPENLL